MLVFFWFKKEPGNNIDHSLFMRLYTTQVLPQVDSYIYLEQVCC